MFCKNMENIDFFLGKRNKQIEAIAKEKGFSRMFFVREISKIEDFNSFNKEQEFYDACLIREKNLGLLRKFIDKAKNYFTHVLVLGVSDEVNRAALEHKKVFALVAPEYQRTYDFLYQRNSGLNHVLCKIAKKNNKPIVFRFSDVQGREEQKALVLGRMAQNLRLCKKYSIDYIFANFSSDPEKILNFKQLKIFERILLSRFKLKKAKDLKINKFKIN